jgi:hypothetical protein
MKMLIGVSAPLIPMSQAAIATIGSALNLRQINMRKPMIDMLAALLGEEPLNWDYKFTGDTYINELASSVDSLEASLALCLRNKASNFFIQRAAAEIELFNAADSGFLYSGQIVSGLRTEQESKWIRDQGGIVIHIQDYSLVGQGQFHALAEKDGDLIINTGPSLPTSEKHVWETIEKIRDVFGTDKKAA